MYSHGSSGHVEYLYLFPDTCNTTAHQDMRSICIYFLVHVLTRFIRACRVSVSISWYMYSHGSSGHAEYLYLFPDTCTHTAHQDMQSICIYFLIHVLTRLIRTCRVSVSISRYMYSHSSSGHAEYLYLFPDTYTHTVHQDMQSICIYFLIHVLTRFTRTYRVSVSISWYMYSHG